MAMSLFSSEVMYIKKKKKKKLKLVDDDGDGDDDDSRRTGFDSLPRDILADILSRLPITSLIQFRFVCRACHVMSRDPLLVQPHLTRATTSNPCLIIHCDYPIRNQLAFVESLISGDDDCEPGGGGDGGDEKELVKAKKIHIPFCSSMPEFNVVGSCNGLLCLSDSLYNDSLYVFNPFTRNYMELPKSRQYQEQEVLFGFGSNPTTNEYKLVKIVYYRNPYNGPRKLLRIHIFPKSEVQVLSLASNTWRSIGKAAYRLDRSIEPCLVNGRIHWVTRTDRVRRVPGRIIVSFDVEDEQFREVSKPEHGSLSKRNHQLAVLKGCLSAVISCGYGKLEIWVMKDYDVKESWIKEFNIGAYMPKLLKQESPRFVISRKGGTGRMVKALCVMNNGEILLQYGGGTLVLYNPETKKFKNGVFTGMPSMFQAIAHVGSLNWIDVPIHNVIT